MDMNRENLPQLNYRYPAKIVINDMIVIHGETENISLNNALIRPSKYSSKNIGCIGEIGKVFLHVSRHETLEFPCEITHVAESGIAILFNVCVMLTNSAPTNYQPGKSINTQNIPFLPQILIIWLYRLNQMFIPLLKSGISQRNVMWPLLKS